ncbi:ATP-dependent DNA ligase [Streptomyces sp. NPDC001970]
MPLAIGWSVGESRYAGGVLLEGELVVRRNGRLPLEAVQHRAFAGGRTVEQRATTLPAHFIDFDVLQTAGQEVITEPYDHRGAVLEDLFTEQEPTPPGTFCPMTTDIAVAQEWPETWTDVQGGGDLVDRIRGCPLSAVREMKGF